MVCFEQRAWVAVLLKMARGRMRAENTIHLFLCCFIVPNFDWCVVPTIIK